MALDSRDRIMLWTLDMALETGYGSGDWIWLWTLEIGYGSGL